MRLPLDNNPKVKTEYMVPNTGSMGRHLGLDWAAAVGTKVFCPGNGFVSDVSTGAAGGKTVAVDIGNYTWRFLHLNEQLVRKGQLVLEGEVLGKTGKTGQVTGPHLHCDARKKGTTWNASLSNYSDPRTIVAEANKPKPSGKRLYFSPVGQTATFFKVKGGEYKMYIKDSSYNWNVLENQGHRVRVNSKAAGGDCWVYLIYQSGSNKGKAIPGRTVR